MVLRYYFVSLQKNILYMMQKRYLKYSLIVLCAILVILILVAGYFINYGLANSGPRRSEEATWDSMSVRYPQMKVWADSVRQGEIQREWLVNENGDSIRMYYIPAAQNTQRTVVLTHGYKDDAICMMHIGYMFHHDMGFNIVAYDQYAHGASSGEMIQMGWKDRKNLIMCTRRAQELFGDSIILHGISMGAATVMMASGDAELPTSVRMVIEDCGYTSVWDEYVGELRNQFGLPAFPLLHIVNVVCMLTQDWSFTEASALEAVSRTHLPMLFIHGDNDLFVPTEMVFTLANAHKGHNALWLAPGSEHAMSYHDHPGEYTERVRDFINW